MHGWHIFVLRHGWNLVGIAKNDPDDFSRVILTRPAVIRRWGTQRGLGQLAKQGPLPETVLDAEPDGVSLNKLDIMRSIPCVASAWEKATYAI